MRLKCKACCFVGNEEYFYKPMSDSSSSKKCLLAYICPKCEAVSHDYDTEESKIVFEDEVNDWALGMAIENMSDDLENTVFNEIEDHGTSVVLKEIIKYGFKGIYNMTIEELEKWYNDRHERGPLGGVVVLENEEYGNKYHS